MADDYVAPARFLYRHAHLRAGEGRTVCGQEMRDEELWQMVPEADVGTVCSACTRPDQQRGEELTLV